jgi:bacillithiol biosynthesis deacetylase BshB1
VLVIGAHPDDAEVGMGGTLCLLHRQGYRLGLLDLTRGELGSKGTPERRRAEADAAATIFGAAFRRCLDLGDGHITDDIPTAQRLAALIRQCRPKLVFTHHGADRHPDHRGAHALVSRAVFQASLKTLDLGGVPFHVPDRLIFFPINEWLEPSFVIDVTPVWSERLATLRAFESQFVEPSALIDHKYFGVSNYEASLEARARLYGQKIGVTFGEGFVTHDAVPVADPVQTFARG